MKTDSRPQAEAAFLTGDDAPSPGGVDETLRTRLARCVERLEDPALEPAWVVHEVRKDLKRVRALLRLAHEALPTKRLEQACAAAARQLAPLRDADATGETIARLRLRADARQAAALDELEQWFRAQRTLGGHPGLPREAAGEVAWSLRQVADALEGLAFEPLDDVALNAGLAQAWNDTAHAYRRIIKKPVLPRFHEFRKSVKRELYQRELSGQPLDRMERATLKKLADVLGELQDLDVLRTTLRETGRWRGPARKLVRQTMRELKSRAMRLGGGRYLEVDS